MDTGAKPQQKRARAEPSTEPKRARTEFQEAVVESVRPLAARDAKPVVDEIKAKLKGKKFYPGDHAETRSICFSTPRFPLEKAEQLLGVGADGKPLARLFKGEEIVQILRVKPDMLKATLYKKPHRFSKPGATATRIGIAQLKLLSMDVSYKAGTLRGNLKCINAPDPEEVAHAARMARLQVAHEAARKTEAERIKHETDGRPDLQVRPVLGDTVRIVDTPHVRSVLPGSIGHKVTISGDDCSGVPFRVCHNRVEAPCAFYPEDLKLLAKVADSAPCEPRRVLEFSANKLKMLCPDFVTFMNFHRALQTCIQSCKGNNAENFHFEFGGQTISSEKDDTRCLSELQVGDEITYKSEFNASYGNHKFMILKVIGACAAPASAGETPWERPKFLDEDFLPRCAVATSEKTRDTANWRLCHMRFDLKEYPKQDDRILMNTGACDSSFNPAFASSLRRRTPGKFRREAMVKRMSLDLESELQVAQAADRSLSDTSIERCDTSYRKGQDNRPS